MKSKFISLFPWSVALLFFGVSAFYRSRWNDAVKQRDYLDGVATRAATKAVEYCFKYDSVVKITQMDEGYFKDIILDSSQPNRVISSPNSTIVLGNANKVNVKN